MLVFATVSLEARLEPYALRFCLLVFHSCDDLLSKISVWKLPANALEVLSFVTCRGSKCSDYNDLSSPLLFHEIIHGDSIDPFATAPGRKRNNFPINIFARVCGIANYNQMSRDLLSARVDFRRKMFELLEKSMTNVLARLESELRRLKLRRSLIRHLPLNMGVWT